MNNQEAFDSVASHLTRQKKKSVYDFFCMYRGPSGLSCAIGCLIPDTLYRKDFEEKNITQLHSFLTNPEFKDSKRRRERDLFEVGLKLVDYFRNVDHNLLVRLQEVHDQTDVVNALTNEFDVKDLKKRLRNVAKDFNLKTSV